MPGRDGLTWVPSGSNDVTFERSGGWRSTTNFGELPTPFDQGEILLASDPMPTGGILPGNTTVWTRTAPSSRPWPADVDESMYPCHAVQLRTPGM